MDSIACIDSPIGRLTIKGTSEGISEILFDAEESSSDAIPSYMEDCVNQLKAYFEDDLKVFNLKLNPQGTDFQKEVWQTLTEIPYGKVISYKAEALKMNNLKAIRAIAAANGKNPLPIVVPCHRVIGSDGSLTGYASGLWRKKWLLEHENALKQQSLF